MPTHLQTLQLIIATDNDEIWIQTLPTNVAQKLVGAGCNASDLAVLDSYEADIRNSVSEQSVVKKLKMQKSDGSVIAVNATALAPVVTAEVRPSNAIVKKMPSELKTIDLTPVAIEKVETREVATVWAAFYIRYTVMTFLLTYFRVSGIAYSAWWKKTI